MRVLFAPNLGWRDVYFQRVLSARLNRQCSYSTTSMRSPSARRSGAARGSKDMLCVFVGTGVGMGAVVGGRLLRESGLAGEMATQSGRHGERAVSAVVGRRCLEAYVAGRHLGRSTLSA